MRLSSSSAVRRVLVALAVLTVAVGACNLFATDQHEVWVCLNPITGKEDVNTYDANHYVGTVFDPCHCYDPCGPLKSCPIVVEAGPPGPGCDAGAGSDGGDAGGW